MFTRFPAALSPAPAIQWTPSFDHLYAGVVMGADWMGSSLPVLGDEWRPDAVSALLDTLPWSPVIGAGEVESILPGAPRGAQSAISSVPLSDRLVVVEAPTGTGKTETAVMRGLALMKAGEVDGFYFAVPSRTAATELHARVARLVSSHSPALAGTVVRAVPGQIDTDPWQRSTDSWAIGCSKRVAYAPIAVGTIDQLMMSSLRTRHAWMRHTAFSRQLLIIDEVHASDPYMSEVVRVLVKRHLDLGGHALLMSATLGETLRADLHLRPRMDFASACAVPYPSVNGVPVSAPETRSAVSVLDYPGARAQVRECVVSQGGCALVIRSTVDTALQTFDELTAAGIPAILHHSRYADVDRRELDRRVMGVIGPGGSRTPVAIVSTQTCEQSLDIDADLLVSDPAPADVLLQRRGRLGRHRDGVFPMIVLDTGDIDAFYPTALRLAKGKPGRLPAGAQWAYVYDLVSTAASVEWLRGRTHLSIPDDVREWVEVATHPEALADFADSRGWGELFSETRGSASGLRQLASGVTLDWSRPYMEQPVQPDERVMTRLGEGSVTVELVTPLVSPVSGQKIHGIPVPWRWLRGVPPGTAGVAVGGVVTVGSVVLSYDGRGLSRT
jgi:CRISPR-associated endonuclease/helicase Cas3